MKIYRPTVFIYVQITMDNPREVGPMHIPFQTSHSVCKAKHLFGDVRYHLGCVPNENANSHGTVLLQR